MRVSAGEDGFATGTTGEAATPGEGVGAAIGMGAIGAASGEPHVMQKRMPGAFCEPQRGHFVCSAFGMTDAGGDTLIGGCGTPMGGVGGAMRGCRRAPQSSQNTRWSAFCFPHVAQITTDICTRSQRVARFDDEVDADEVREARPDVPRRPLRVRGIREARHEQRAIRDGDA